MALDKAVDSAKLNSELSSVANAIRTKGKTSAQLVFPTGFVTAIENIQTGEKPKLIVTTNAGASVTAAKGSQTVSGTADAAGSCTLELPEAGTWSVTATLGSDTATKDILIGTQELDMSVKLFEAFADNTWGAIIKACQSGTIPSTWAVGDFKSMEIGGTEYRIDIIGKNHDDYADGSGKAPLTFMLHDCYGGSTQFYPFNAASEKPANWEGWTNCDMRLTTLPAILALMPAEVQAGIRLVSKLTTFWKGTMGSVVTTSDKLFLLSSGESVGNKAAGAGQSYSYTLYGNGWDGTQYAYFAENAAHLIKNVGKSQWDDGAWLCRSSFKDKSYTYTSVSVTAAGTGNLFDVADTTRNLSFGFCF